MISNPESVVSESHAPELEGGAEYPHYTRPAEFRGWEVPEVLRSGHHAEIDALAGGAGQKAVRYLFVAGAPASGVLRRPAPPC